MNDLHSITDLCYCNGRIWLTRERNRQTDRQTDRESVCLITYQADRQTGDVFVAGIRSECVSGMHSVGGGNPVRFSVLTSRGGSLGI